MHRKPSQEHAVMITPSSCPTVTISLNSKTVYFDCNSECEEYLNVKYLYIGLCLGPNRYFLSWNCTKSKHSQKIVADMKYRFKSQDNANFNSPIQHYDPSSYNEDTVIIFYDFETNREVVPIGVNLMFCNSKLEEDTYYVEEWNKLPNASCSSHGWFCEQINWATYPFGFLTTKGASLTCFVFNPNNTLFTLKTFFKNMFTFLIQITQRKTKYVFIAHNGGKFDHFFTIRYLIEWGEETNTMTRDWRFLSASGRVLGCETPISDYVAVSFKDSIVYLPLNDRSLRGAARELKLNVQKEDLSYETMFLFCDYLQLLFQSTDERVHYFLSTCKLPIDVLKKAQLFDLTYENGSPFINVDSTVNKLEAFENNSLHTLPELIGHYCEMDVIVLREIIKTVFETIFAPHLPIKFKQPIYLMEYPTLSSMMYHNMLYTIQDKDIQVHSHFVDQFVRKSIYGGRVSSPIIGEAVGYRTNFTTSLEYTMAREEMLNHIIQLLPSTPCQETKLWPTMDTFSKELQNMLHQFYIHLDICSQYPSSLTQDLPIGPAHLVTSENAAMLTYLFSLTVDELVDIFNNEGIVFGVLKVRIYKSLSEYIQVRCEGHHCHKPLIVPNIPYRDREGSLLWIGGMNTGDDMELFGIWNTQDLLQAKRDGWNIEVIESLPVNDCGPKYGIMWEKGEHYIKSFMAEKFEGKKEGARTGNMGLYMISKISMNGSYGSTLFDVLSKTEYQVEEHTARNSRRWATTQATYYPLNESGSLVLSATKMSNNSAKTNNRPTYIGSFCLSGSRVMIWQLREALTLNAKIVYIDTDSMTCQLGDAVPLAKDTFIHEGDELGHFDSKRQMFHFNIAYEATNGKTCSWWNEHGYKMPCLLDCVVVLARKVYSEKCFFCQQTRVRSKGVKREDMSFDIMYKIVSYKMWHEARFYSFSLFTPYFYSYLPPCYLEDTLSKWFGEHRVGCPTCHLIPQLLEQSGPRPYLALGLTCPPLGSIQTSRSSLKVTLFSKNGCFEVKPTTLTRSVGIVFDIKGQLSVKCSCNMHLGLLVYP